MGTRHRAALGIAERTDTVSIVVSEEDGSISIAQDGNLHHGLSQEELQETLKLLFSHHIPKA